MNRIALEIATTDRPLTSLNIDPSSELGAHLTGCRLRLYWLRRGYDVPVVVRQTVAAAMSTTKARRQPCYAAQLDMPFARKVTGHEVFSIQQLLLDEVEALVTSPAVARKVAA
jgi:hypothetical protein